MSLAFLQPPFQNCIPCVLNPCYNLALQAQVLPEAPKNSSLTETAAILLECFSAGFSEREI